MTHTQQLLGHLRGRLIVSCQAPPASPMHDPYVIARLALTAERYGAGAVRIDSPTHVTATRALCRVPVIGLHKQAHDESAVYITPTAAAAVRLIEAGADVVAIDGTPRPRPHGERLGDIIDIIHAHKRQVLADIATEAQALAAADLGADIISTMLAAQTQELGRRGPDLALVERLAALTPLPIVCEGRVRSADHVRQAFSAGAYAVVVGSAITGVDVLVRHFVEATPSGLADTVET